MAIFAAVATRWFAEERRLLKMFANLLESHYEVKELRNRLTFAEYEKTRAVGAL